MLVCTLLCLLPGESHASAGARVLLITSGPTAIVSEASTRVQAELLSDGMVVTFKQVDSPVPEVRAILKAELETETWTAIVLVVEAAPEREPSALPQYDVWAYNTARKRLVADRLTIAPDQTTSIAATLAIKSLEVLRASLLIFDSPEKQAAEGGTPPNRPPLRLQQKGASPWLVGVGFGALSTTGLLQPSFGPRFRAAYSRLAWGLAVVADPLSSEVQVASSPESGSWTRASLALEASFPLSRHRIAPHWLASAGLAIFSFEGNSSEAFVGIRSRSLVGFGATGMGLTWRVAESWLVSADSSLQFTPGAPEIRLHNNIQGPVGRWQLNTSATVLVTL